MGPICRWLDALPAVIIIITIIISLIIQWTKRNYDNKQRMKQLCLTNVFKKQSVIAVSLDR